MNVVFKTMEKEDIIDQEVSSILKEVYNFADSVKNVILSLDVFEEKEKQELVSKLESLKK